MSPFQHAMLKSASAATLPQSARGMRTELPDQCATASMPTAANGSVSARKVSGAISVTPILRIGQLQPQISVRTATGRSAAAVIGDAAVAALLFPRAALTRAC